jgi:hypothetical protein
LLLVWDLNCGDPRFRVNRKPIFKHLERLPLYFCFRCLGDMDYYRIRVLKSTGTYYGEGFPYQRFPIAFERQPIESDRPMDAPGEVRKALDAVDLMDRRLSKEVQGPLEKWLGRPLTCGMDVWWHQFGGRPNYEQGPERFPCPNEACSWSRQQWAMKILAVQSNDPPAGLPMFETLKDVKKNHGHFNWYTQVIFHICKGCLTLHAANRCD